jgi:hypothetical protein
MMMSKRRPIDETKQASSVKMPESSNPKTATDAVEDLERRLALLGGVTSSDLPLSETEEAAPAFALLPPIATTPEDAAVSVGVPLKGGKNALLVRFDSDFV